MREDMQDCGPQEECLTYQVGKGGKQGGLPGGGGAFTESCRMTGSWPGRTSSMWDGAWWREVGIRYPASGRGSASPAL